MSKLFKISIIAILCASPFMGKSQDTCSHFSLPVHQFTPTQLIAPAVGIGLGSAMTYVPQLNKWNVSLRDAVQKDGHEPLKIDDYIQYAPAASVYALKLCGVESRHSYRDITNLMASSYMLTAAVVLSTKELAGIQRPDGRSYNSFPSGHTATAFVGAEMLRREYGEKYPLIGIAGYTVAAGVGAMRIYNNRHWAGDVLAGAGVGILCTCLSYWLAPYLRF